MSSKKQQGKGGRPLPKFGEWDVNNPASADGFTVIFSKARDEKKTTGTAALTAARPQPQPTPPPPNDNQQHDDHSNNYDDRLKKRWLCCF